GSDVCSSDLRLRSANGTSSTTTEGRRSRHHTSSRDRASAGSARVESSLTSRGHDAAGGGTGSSGPTTRPRPNDGGPGNGAEESPAPAHTGALRHPGNHRRSGDV